jgi:hypothetical protein
MSYIGSKPADAVLETDDIADGVVTTSKLADDSVTNPKLFTGSQQNFRNIIINGDMSIAQRSTSVASITTGGYKTVDRFQADVTNIGTWTQSQSTDTPTGQGFATSLKMDCTTADASPAAGDLLRITQRIEGQNIQYLKKGTANAVSLTLSFWVKSNKTGTYIAELFDDNSRSISKSYTVNTTNTWEKKTITYEGDTTGTIDNDNTIGLSLHLWLAAGSTYTSGTLATTWGAVTSANRAVGQVNLADDTSNEWYITGVQLEAGTTASDFEFLPVDVNLQRCQRYYQLIAQGISAAIRNAFAYNSTQAAAIFSLPNPMRATPSIDQTSGASYYRFQANATNYAFSSFTFDFGTGNQIFGIRTTSITGLTGGHSGNFQATNASSYFALTSEL